MERVKYQLNGLNVTLIKTDKFKTTDLVINFKQLLDEKSVTRRALIPHVLKSATKNYQNKKAINQKLEQLYGASLGISVNKQGLLHILSFRMSIINDKFLLKNETLLDMAIAFFNEVIFQPLQEGDGFSERVVIEEKRLLKEQFTALYDDKIRYSYHRLIEEMCKTEKYRIKSIGRVEDLEKITPKNLYDSYQKMLTDDTADLLVIGDIDIERLKGLIEKYFVFDEREVISKVVDKETKTIREVAEIIEVKEISQAKLNLGFRTNVTGVDDDYYALLLMNALLGVYPSSLLFKNVREKASLCYYIASNIDKGKGLLIIYAGINHNDYQKAYDIIIEQIAKLQKGEFTEALIEMTRKALINDILQISDNPIAFLSTEYSHLLYQDAFDVKNEIERINQVTKEDISNVAKKLQEDTIFLLTNEEVSK